MLAATMVVLVLASILAGGPFTLSPSPAAAELGGQRLHLTAVMTGAQPDGNAVQADLDCSPPLKFPTKSMYFYGPGDQDVNAQGMGQCTLVVTQPPAALSQTVRCVADGEATCLSDRTVRGTGQYLVTFTIITRFPEVPAPTTTASLPAAVPPDAGPGGPPSTTSNAPLPTDGANPTGAGNPADPASSGGATRADGAGSPTGDGGTGAGTEGASGAGGTTIAGGGPAGTVAVGAATSGSVAPAPGGDAGATPTDSAAGSSARNALILLLLLPLVLACVAGGVLGGRALRRRTGPPADPPPGRPLDPVGTSGSAATHEPGEPS